MPDPGKSLFSGPILAAVLFIPRVCLNATAGGALAFSLTITNEGWGQRLQPAPARLGLALR